MTLLINILGLLIGYYNIFHDFSQSKQQVYDAQYLPHSSLFTNHNQLRYLR